MKRYITILLVIFISQINILNAQQIENITNLVESKLLHANTIQNIHLNENELISQLDNKSESVTLPFLDQHLAFKVQEFSMYGDGPNSNPDIKTYKLFSKFDKTIIGRITTGPGGVNISYLKNGKLIRIYPDTYEPNRQRKYTQEIGIGNKSSHNEMYCETHDAPIPSSVMTPDEKKDFEASQKRNGSTRRVYRVALMCTGEFAELNGSGARQLMISSLNDISAIFEKDMNFELQLSSGSPVVHSNSSSDPFDPLGGARTTQAQSAISNAFNPNRYELGHVFHTNVTGGPWDSGGLAGLGVICNDNRKAQGWSGSFTNTNNAWIQLASHEFGHQFNATHTFNGIGGLACTEGNHPINTAYEIGSGTTIMSYQGLCEDDNNIPSQGVSDNYFHVNSLDLMTNYAEVSGICNEAAWVVDSNNEPIAMANPCGAIYDIPRLTPFMLIGEATDADGDVMTYNWEQYDEDGQGQRPTHGLIGGDAANSRDGAPLYRSYPPNEDPTRTIPRLSDLSQNISSDFEVLTRVGRDINFRFVVRDNNPNGGAIDWDQIKINTNAAMGPLTITSQANGETVQAGSIMEVVWDPRSSEPLCDKAVIKLSLDGGLSFPFDIAKDVNYDDGSAMVTIPASFSNSDRARIMVACDDYECFTFFDINNRNFVIESNCFAPGSILCDDSDDTYLFGDPALDLNEDVIDGSTFNTLTGPLEAVATWPLVVNDQFNDCQIINNVDNPYQIFEFSVTQSGSYVFSLDILTDGTVRTYSIFEKESFSVANPCNSYLGSSGRYVGQSYSVAPEFSVTLEACKEYYIIAQLSSQDFIDLALTGIDGPGDAILSEASPDYALTFMAFDANTEVIVAINDEADFRTLPAGEYFIKSAYYKISGPTPPDIVDPNTLIGLTQVEMLGSVNCIFPSGNQKNIVIDATCFVENITEVSRTDCNPITNTYDITLSFNVDMGPGSGDVTINGQTFPITGDANTVTLVGLVSNGEMVDLDFQFSDDQGCDRIYEDVFQASANCCPIAIDLGQDRTLCFGDIELLDGGSDGISFAWFRDGNLMAETSQIIEVTNSGNYSVLVTNNTGCVNESSVNLTFESLPTVSLSTNNVDACFGEIFEIELFTNSNDIDWYQESTLVASDQSIFEVSEPGNYSVIVSNSFGCTDTAEFVAIFKDAPEVYLGPDTLTCNGSTIQLDAQLSGNNYSYEWRRNFSPTGGSTQILEVTTFGVYTVTVTDGNNGCESNDTINIDYEALPNFDLGGDKTRCEGDLYTIDAEEDSAFEINWYLDGEIIQDEHDLTYTALVSGEYVSIIEHNEQCIESDTIIIRYLDAPDVDFPDVISACPGDEVMLVVDDNNATFTWFSEADGELSENSNTLTVTEGGTYSVFASSTTTFCPKRDTVLVEFINVPALNLGDDINGCEGQPVTLSSITNGFLVEWYFNGQLISGENGPSIDVTEAGEYRIAINGSGSCTAEDIINVTFSESPSVDLGDDRAACPGETVTLDGGDINNAYVWSSEEDGLLSFTTNTIDVTKSGTYYVTVTNTGNCSTLDTVVITFTDLPQLNLGPDISNCDDNIHTISIDSENFDLEWYLDDVLLASTDDQLLADLPGTYIARISAGENCSISDTLEVIYNEYPDVDLGDDRSACPGDQIDLVIDDTGNTYIWSTEESGILPDITNTLAVLETGTYIVEVTNPEGCTTRDTTRIEFTPLPNLDLGTDINVCQGEDVTLSGESNGFAIEWYLDGILINGEESETLNINESGSYIMKVSSSLTCTISDTIEVVFFDAPIVDLGEDRSACPGEMVILDGGDDTNTIEWTALSTGILSETGSALSVTESDTYSIVSTNAGNCSTRDTVTITFTELPMLDLGADITDICAGVELELIANSNGFETSWFLNDNEIIGANEESLYVTESGTYIALAAASQDCSVSDTIQINFIDAPNLLDIADEVACIGTTVNLVVGTDDEFQFIWSKDAVVVQDGGVASLEVIESGVYTVEVINSSNCISRDTAEITFIDQPTIEIPETLSFCDGEEQIISANSNVSVLEWYKDDSIIAGESDINLAVTESGEYIAVVGSGTQCEARDTTLVNLIAAPEFSIDGINEACSIDLPLMLSVNLETDETVQWYLDGNEISGETSANLEVNVSGQYSASVINSTGCMTSDTFDFSVSESPLNNLSPIPDLCIGDDFTIEAMTDGTSFTWSDATGVLIDETDLEFSISNSGTYTFTSTNDAGCETTTSFDIVFNEIPIVDLGPAEQSACIGFDIAFELEANAGSTYSWFKDGTIIPGEESNTFAATESGTYSVIVENEFGCTESAETIVTFFNPPSLTVPTSQEFCEGASAPVTIDTDASIIRWILNGNTVANDIKTFDILTGGLYTIEVESEDSCIISEEIEITEVAPPDITIEDIELCPGESAEIDLNPDFSDYFWDGIVATGSSATIDYEAFDEITSQNASVTVMNQANCSTTEEFTVTFFPPINAGVLADKVGVCIGESKVIEATGGLFYEWSDPDQTLSATNIANPIASPTTSTIYNVQISDNCPGNIANLSVEVIVNDLPEANAGMDTCAIAGFEFELSASGGVNYQWNNTDLIIGANNMATATIEITEPTQFIVTVTDDNGCESVDSVEICILEDPSEVLQAVTVITPNGDATNDNLTFRGLEAYPENELTIFNRWGNIIFKKRGYQVDELRWDGTRDGIELPADTYYYILEFQNFKIKKSITLLRD